MLLPICVMIGMGALGKRTGLLSPGIVTGMKNLVTHIFLPALVFDTMAHAGFGSDSLVLFGCSMAFHLILFGAARKIRHCFGENAALYPYLIECYECGMIGYSLIGALVGTENLALVAIMDMGSCIFGFTILTGGLSLLAGEKSEHGVLWRIMHTPTFIAVVLGAVAGSIGIGAWIDASAISGIYENTIGYLTAPLTPVILLCIGYDLRFDPDMIGDILKVAVTRIGMSMIFLAITLGVCSVMNGLNRLLITTLVMYFALPPSFLSPVYVREEKQARFVSGYLSFTIVFALLVFAALCVYYLS